jgi:hypothetical protein
MYINIAACTIPPQHTSAARRPRSYPGYDDEDEEGEGYRGGALIELEPSVRRSLRHERAHVKVAHQQRKFDGGWPRLGGDIRVRSVPEVVGGRRRGWGGSRVVLLGE